MKFKYRFCVCNVGSDWYYSSYFFYWNLFLVAAIALPYVDTTSVIANVGTTWLSIAAAIIKQFATKLRKY